MDKPGYKKLLIESYASGKALTKLLRTKTMNILDNQQRKRLQELMDNPPPHVQYLVQKLRRE